MRKPHLGLALLAALLLAFGVTRGEAPAAPELAGDVWLGSPPLSLAALRGTHVRSWHERFAPQGLIVIGVHTPELAHERDLDNLKRYLKEHRVRWPVLVDDEFRTWRAYRNRYWPALYLIDKRGRIRHERFGEGGYAETEGMIEQLLAE